jgi:hypothetical protein
MVAFATLQQLMLSALRRAVNAKLRAVEREAPSVARKQCGYRRVLIYVVHFVQRCQYPVLIQRNLPGNAIVKHHINTEHCQCTATSSYLLQIQ